MRQYAEGAVMFDAAQPAFATDRKVQTGWAQAFVSMKPADYHVPDRQIQILGPDVFVSSGTEMYTIASGSARPTISAPLHRRVPAAARRQLEDRPRASLACRRAPATQK